MCEDPADDHGGREAFEEEEADVGDQSDRGRPPDDLRRRHSVLFHEFGEVVETGR